MTAVASIDSGFILKKLSSKVYCIKEEKTNILMYFICGQDKSALIDTGSGGEKNLLKFIEKMNLLKPKQKLIVINTHNHAEQTGGNWNFSSIGKIGKAHCVEDLCASAADKNYTRLLDSSFDWQVKPYKITRWLQNGEVIKLGKNEELFVYYGPGHTPDSLYILFPSDNRIFLGDIFHQFDEILLMNERSSIKQLIQTVISIQDYCYKSPNKLQMKYSSSKNDSNELCLPILKNYLRFLYGIVAGIQKEIPLRVDEHYGSRFETRDKLIKVVLSRPLILQLKNARKANTHDDSSSAFGSTASTL